MAVIKGNHMGIIGGRSRWAESLMSVILVCWGAVFLAYFARGDLVAYVAPSFRPIIAAAGAALAAIGFLLCLLPAGGCCGSEGEADEEGCGHATCGHDHGHSDGITVANLVRAVMLLAPLALLLVVKPEGFSATTVRNRGIMRAAPPAQRKLDVNLVRSLAVRSSEQPRKLPAEAIFTEPEETEAMIGPGGVDELTVYDILVLGADPELRQKLDGTRVRVLGQFVQNAKRPGSFDLVRMFIVCCAADARVLGISVDGRGPAGAEEMEWIEVDGRLRFEGGEKGAPQPLIHAENVRKAEEPEEPFLY